MRPLTTVSTKAGRSSPAPAPAAAAAADCDDSDHSEEAAQWRSTAACALTLATLSAAYAYPYPGCVPGTYPVRAALSVGACCCTVRRFWQMILSCWSQCALLASRLAAHCGRSEQATAQAKGLLPFARNGRTSLMYCSAVCGPRGAVRCGRHRSVASHSHCSSTGTFATLSLASA